MATTSNLTGNDQLVEAEVSLPPFLPAEFEPSDSETHMSSSNSAAPADQQFASATRGVQLENVVNWATRLTVERPITPSRMLGKRGSALHTKQYWEGIVTAVGADEFSAIVKDRTEGANPDEEVTISVEEISPSDRQLLETGAGFYWFIGAERTPGGQQKNVSLIQFRRTPRWTRSRLNRASAQASSFLKALGLPEAE